MAGIINVRYFKFNAKLSSANKEFLLPLMTMAKKNI